MGGLNHPSTSTGEKAFIILTSLDSILTRLTPVLRTHKMLEATTYNTKTPKDTKQGDWSQGDWGQNRSGNLGKLKCAGFQWGTCKRGVSCHFKHVAMNEQEWSQYRESQARKGRHVQEQMPQPELSGGVVTSGGAASSMNIHRSPYHQEGNHNQDVSASAPTEGEPVAGAIVQATQNVSDD